MKNSLSKIKTTLKAMWQDEAAQGATEYILLLVVVVGLAMMFKPQISKLLGDKMNDISQSVNGFTSQ